MCGFYDDGRKIKKGDNAIFDSKKITILEVKHIKTNKTMDITYKEDDTDKQCLLNIPYKTTGYNIQLL